MMTQETTTLPTTSGLNYANHQDLVETIVSMKKAKYNFPSVDIEDTAQDIRLICWDALLKYDPVKVGKSIFHFVARCVDNALYNKYRGVYLDNNPPCLRCEYYVKADKSCAIDEVGCDRIVSYRRRMAQKRAIAAPLSYNTSFGTDEEGSEFSNHESLSVGSTTGVCDLDDTLRTELDANLVQFYDAMVNGDSDDVPAHYRRLVQRQVRIILEEDE